MNLSLPYAVPSPALSGWLALVIIGVLAVLLGMEAASIFILSKKIKALKEKLKETASSEFSPLSAFFLLTAADFSVDFTVLGILAVLNALGAVILFGLSLSYRNLQRKLEAPAEVPAEPEEVPVDGQEESLFPDFAAVETPLEDSEELTAHDSPLFGEEIPEVTAEIPFLPDESEEEPKEESAFSEVLEFSEPIEEPAEAAEATNTAESENAEESAEDLVESSEDETVFAEASDDAPVETPAEADVEALATPALPEEVSFLGEETPAAEEAEGISGLEAFMAGQPAASIPPVQVGGKVTRLSAEGEDEDSDEKFNATERIIGYNEDTGCYRIAHYRKSFEARLIQARPNIKQYYSGLKNALLSYKNTKSRLSWTCDSFHNGRTQIAKINVKTGVLEIYFAIDPASLEGSVYRGRDVGKQKKYADTPFAYKIRTPRKFKWALELVEKVAEEKGLSPMEIEQVDYVATYAYDDTESLIRRGLIKEYVREEKASTSFEFDPDAPMNSFVGEGLVSPVNAAPVEEDEEDEDEEDLNDEKEEELEEEPLPEIPTEEVVTEVPEEVLEKEPEEPAEEIVEEEIPEEPVEEIAEEEIPEEPAEEIAEEEIPEEPTEEIAEEEILEEPVEEIVEEEIPEEPVEEIVEEELPEEPAEEIVEEEIPEEELYDEEEATVPVEEVIVDEPSPAYESPAEDEDKETARIDLCFAAPYFPAGATVNIETLLQQGLILSTTKTLKVDASGPLNKPLNVEAHHFTMNAIRAISEAGGDLSMIR